MNIDYGLPEGIQEDAREDLHVPSHNDELDVVFLENRKLLGFGLRLRVLSYRDVLEWHAVLFRSVPQIVVIGDNQGDIAWVITGFIAEHQVMKTVIRFGNENRHLWLNTGDSYLSTHSDRVAE